MIYAYTNNNCLLCASNIIVSVAIPTSSNRLSLISSKTLLIWFFTPQQLQKLEYVLLSARFPHFTFSSSYRDLVISLGLTFTEHVAKLTRSSSI